MINIVNYNIHCNDESMITIIEIKLKARPVEAINEKTQHLVARISATFNSLDLFSEHGKSFRVDLNPKRQNVANLRVTFSENSLTFAQIGEFLDTFRQELTQSPF